MPRPSHLEASAHGHRQPPSNRMDDVGGPDAGEQLPLMPVKQHHRENGRRLLALVNRALVENGVSRSRLADELGRDAAQVTRVLDGDGNLPADLLAAVLELDRERVVLAGLADPLGLDLVERRPDPAAEARRYRAELLELRAKLDKVLEGT